MRTVPAPVLLTFVCSRKSLFQSGSARVGGDVRSLVRSLLL